MTTCPRCKKPVAPSVIFCDEHSECVATVADWEHVKIEREATKAKGASK
jgi:hypothetical protein